MMFRIILYSMYIVTAVFGSLTFYDFFYDIRKFNLSRSMHDQEFIDITLPYARVMKFMVSTKSAYLVSPNESEPKKFMNYNIEYSGDVLCNYKTSDIRTIHNIRGSIPVLKKITKDAIIWHYTKLSLPFQETQIDVLERYINQMSKKYIFQEIPCRIQNSKIKIAKIK